tara:strand:+ start:102378 stop:103640 length:1263 start_codon:yes stop_codon:yes gene_type:complete
VRAARNDVAHNKRLRHRAGGRTRARVAVETLESRAMLAGLVNLGDSIIDPFPVASPHSCLESTSMHSRAIDDSEKISAAKSMREHDSPCKETVESGQGLAHQPGDNVDEAGGNDGTGDECNPDGNCHHECDGDEVETKVETELPGDTSPTEQTMRPDDLRSNGWSSAAAANMSVSQDDSVNSFITPIATSAIARDYQSSSVNSSPNAAIDSGDSTFHYFDADQQGATMDSALSLSSRPLTGDAVRETFFNIALIDTVSLDVAHTSSRITELVSKQSQSRSDSNPIVSGKITQRLSDHEYIAVVQDAEAAIAAANESIRAANAKCELARGETGPSEFASYRDLNSQPDSEIVDSLVNSGTKVRGVPEGVRLPYDLRDWRFGLIGILSVFVSARSMGNQRPDVAAGRVRRWPSMTILRRLRR